MNKYNLPLVAIITSIVFFCAACEAPREEAAAGTTAGAKPDVILIAVDTLRADFVGASGGRRSSTPHIDKLAELGVAFTMCISAAPSTGPSFASIHSGLYPYGHGVVFNAHAVPVETNTIAGILKRHGYDTAGFVSSSILGGRYNFDLDFDFYSEKTTRNYSPDDYERSAGELNEELIPWLETRQSKKPLFLWVHYFDPHAPYVAHYGPDAGMSYEQEFLYPLYMEKDVETARKHYNDIVRFYSQEIRYTDEKIGELLRILTRLGYLENSVVVFAADHGEELFEHDNFYGHTRSLYNTVLHVPLVVAVPGMEHSGKVINRTVRTVDIFPTILDITGIDNADQLHGESLMPVIRGEETAHRAAFSMREPVGSFWEGRGFSLIDYPWKLISFEKTENRLFNIEKDRRERLNIISDNQTISDTLDKRLDRHISGSPPARRMLDEQDRKLLKDLGYIR